MVKRVWIAACLFSALTGLGGCSHGRTPTGDVELPGNWPIAGLTLPAGVYDAQFSPSGFQQFTSKLPRRNYGTPRHKPPPPMWNAFFAYKGEPAKVFEHLESAMKERRFKVTDATDLELGTVNESRERTYASADGAYAVSLRYWRVSDGPKKRPYQLLVRDIRTRYEP